MRFSYANSIILVSYHTCFDSFAAMADHQPICMEDNQPIGAPPTKTARWQPISVGTAVVVSGGYQNKTYALDTENVDTSKGQQQFVPVKYGMCWLLHACKGSGYRNGDLKRSTIIDDLKIKAANALTEQDDPMMQIECRTLKGTPSKKPTKSLSKRREECIVSVEADLRPKAAAPNDTRVKRVRVFVNPKNNKNQAICIHKDDLPWLVTHIADEVAFGGVILEPGEPDSEVVKPNSSVPGLRVEWCFQDNVWSGEFLSGPLMGRRVLCGPATFNNEKWKRLVEAGKVEGSYDEVEGGKLEQACLEYLVLHCQNELSRAQSVGETPQ